MEARKQDAPLQVLPQILTEVVVATGKAFKAGKRDGKGNVAEAAAAMDMRVPASIEKFNLALDELECDILRAKAVLMRDLNRLRASRRPPSPEEKPVVAPPSPIIIDLDSPKMEAKEAFPGPPGPPKPGQVNKPVAPFPNMGFDATSPEASLAVRPPTVQRLKEIKNPARPPMAGPPTGRPASAPPKKDPRIQQSQTAKPDGSETAAQAPGPSVQAKPSSISMPNTPAFTAPQSNAPGRNPTVAQVPLKQPKPSSVPAPNVPASAGGKRTAPTGAPVAAQAAPGPPMQAKAASISPPNMPPSTSAPSNAPGPAGHGNLFTDMTFSLAPPAGEVQGQKGAPQPRPPGTDAANPAGGELPGLNVDQNTGPDVANLGKAGDEGSAGGANIEGLFDMGPGGMDSVDMNFDFGGDNGDNSNFNDMYYGTGAGGPAGGGDLDDAYFNLLG
ncbi:hypothetical protein VTK56DRAFT_8472 [Thermocarpiscus australiensis]